MARQRTHAEKVRRARSRKSASMDQGSNYQNGRTLRTKDAAGRRTAYETTSNKWNNNRSVQEATSNTRNGSRVGTYTSSTLLRDGSTQTSGGRVNKYKTQQQLTRQMARIRTLANGRHQNWVAGAQSAANAKRDYIILGQK